MLKKLFFPFFLIIIALLFCGCEKILLVSTSRSTYIQDKIEYAVQPLTDILAKKYDIDILFTNLAFHTTFLMKITNYSEVIFKTHLKDSFILTDANNVQHNIINDPVFYLKEAYKDSKYSDMSFAELTQMEFELENLINSDIATQNMDYIKSQLMDLKQKTYYLERKHLFEDELKKKEKMLKKMLKIYTFEDKIIYPQGSNIGLLIFPRISKEKLIDSKLFFLLPKNKIVSISYTIRSSN